MLFPSRMRRLLYFTALVASTCSFSLNGYLNLDGYVSVVLFYNSFLKLSLECFTILCFRISVLTHYSLKARLRVLM